LLCADHPGALALREHAFTPVETYGRAPDADWHIMPLGYDDTGQRMRLHRNGREFGDFTTTLLGRYNLHNVAAAVAVAAHEGLSFDSVQRALPQFRGIRRRMETFLKSDGITFIEDFAHHPTAIREAIAAVKERWPNEQLTVLFEPRSNTTATNCFQVELGQAFKGANEVWIGPIYRAEKYLPETRLDRDRLIADIARHGARAHFTDDVSAIVRHIRTDVDPHDIVLILSNGAFGGIYDMVRAQFANQEDA
jgi:UDP-N-acetylmuramate: L-alanyl-gamma-D-glutamyl-meso-diaminopimelate ligase